MYVLRNDGDAHVGYLQSNYNVHGTFKCVRNFIWLPANVISFSVCRRSDALLLVYRRPVLAERDEFRHLVDIRVSKHGNAHCNARSLACLQLMQVYRY